MRLDLKYLGNYPGLEGKFRLGIILSNRLRVSSEKESFLQKFQIPQCSSYIVRPKTANNATKTTPNNPYQCTVLLRTTSLPCQNVYEKFYFSLELTKGKKQKSQFYIFLQFFDFYTSKIVQAVYFVDRAMNEYTRYTTNHGQQLRHQNSRSRIGYHAHRGSWEQTTSSPSVGQSRQQPQPVALSLVEPYVIQPEEDIGEDVEEDSCCCWISLILLILLIGLIVGLGIIFTREPPNSTQQAPTSSSQTTEVHLLKIKKYHDFL